MLSNKQMILPGIPEMESLQFEDISSKLRFGVEIECEGFYNGKPLKEVVFSLIENLETGVKYSVELEIERNKNGGEWVDRIIEVITPQIAERETEKNLGCEFGSKDFYRLPNHVRDAWSSPPRSIKLDPTGELPYPWEQDLEYRLWGADEHPNDTLGQTQRLLDENGLKGWKPIYESTVGDSESIGFEIVSPVLKLEDLQSIQKACSIFENLVDINPSCGLHIHVGIEGEDFNLNHLKRLIYRWLQIETQLLTLPFYQEMGTQNNPSSDKINLTLLKRADSMEKIIKAANQKRNQVLNLEALDLHGTVEFRGFLSTFNFNTIETVIKFCLGLISSTASL